MIGKTIDEIKVGDTAEFSKTVSESDVYVYAGVTEDLNPALVNETYARKTFFKTRIVHGMLLVGFVSAILGGPGTIYMKQNLRFLAPVCMGDTVTARVEVTERDTEKNRLTLRTTCANQDGTLVLEGQALVSSPKKPEKEE